MTTFCTAETPLEMSNAFTATIRSQTWLKVVKMESLQTHTNGIQLGQNLVEMILSSVVITDLRTKFLLEDHMTTRSSPEMI